MELTFLGKSVRNLSVKWCTIIALPIVITLILGLSSIWSIMDASRINTQELSNKGQLLANIQAQAISRPMWDLNHEGMMAALVALGKDKDFVFASISDKKTGKILASHGDSNRTEEVLEFFSPTVYDGGSGAVPMGELRLVLSKDSMQQKHWDFIKAEFKLFMILIIVTIGTIYAVLSYFVINPLSNITRSMSKVSTGNGNHLIPVERFDEFGIMVTAFNTMTKNLDKTYRKVEESKKEIIKANVELEEARVNAEVASKTKSAFLANMSHELRTPLNAIIGYTEIMMEEGQDATVKEMLPDLENIIASSNHLLQLITEILELSKIEAGQMTININRLEINEFAEKIKILVSPLMAKGNNRFIVKVDKDLGVIFTDEQKLRQCLNNILGNAAKFTQNGIVTFDIKKLVENKKEWVTFTVTDTGIGMTKEQMEIVFDAFIQVDTSSTRTYGGTGLGLTVAKKSCILMGGDIFVTSKIGEGSTFTVKLPLNLEK